MNIGVCLNFVSFSGILDYQYSDAKTKIHHSSVEKSSSSRYVLLEPLMEEFKLVLVEKHQFENLNKIGINIFGVVGLSRNGRKEETYSLRSQFCTRGKSVPKNKDLAASSFKQNPAILTQIKLTGFQYLVFFFGGKLSNPFLNGKKNSLCCIVLSFLFHFQKGLIFTPRYYDKKPKTNNYFKWLKYPDFQVCLVKNVFKKLSDPKTIRE